MATSLDAINNVGPKLRYRLATFEPRGGPCDIIITPELANALGISQDLALSSSKVNVSQTVRPHLRKQYPGDTTTISVAGHTRVRSVGGTAFNNTYPGKAAYFGVVNEGPPRDQKEIQFQFTGTFKLLLAEFGAKVTRTPSAGEIFYLRSPNGVPKVIETGGGV